MDISQIKGISIVGYLSKKGFEPTSTSGKNYYYKRYYADGDGKEHLSVNIEKNVFIDRVTGKGGTIIDLVKTEFNCSENDAIARLKSENFTCNEFTVPKSKLVTSSSSPSTSNTIKIKSITQITKYPLWEYLRRRCISKEIANIYCRQINFNYSQSDNKEPLYAVGFRTNSDGYILRNNIIKQTAGKLDISTIDFSDNKDYIVFEGFFNFLSYVELYGEPTSNVIVLNSVANEERAYTYFERATHIYLYLDNDEAGDKATAVIKEKFGGIVEDKRDLYSSVNDLNDYLVSRTKIIEIPENTISEKAKKGERIYLSDFLKELPPNCVLNKNATNCGATTRAITDNINSIIAMPTKEAIKSKQFDKDGKENPDILCVYGGCHDSLKDLREYVLSRVPKEDGITNNSPIKIICTYDQAETIIMRLSGKEKINGTYTQSENTHALCLCVSDYRLVIDEIHQLFFDYSTEKRREKIKGLLKCVSLFDNVVAMSATPVPRNFLFRELRKLDYKIINFPQVKYTIKNIYSNRITVTVDSIIQEHLDGKRLGNAHIFVNDVGFIGKFNTEKYKSNIRIVCADNEKNRNKLNGNICSVTSPVKKINFYTAACFQAADILDKDAVQYIITIDNKQLTKYDISTSFLQILGRIRDCKNNDITHIHNISNHIQKDWQEGENAMKIFNYNTEKKDTEKKRNEYLEWQKNGKEGPYLYNDIPEETLNKWYLFKETDNKYYYDEIMEWLDDYSWQIQNIDYNSNYSLSQKFENIGINTIEKKDEYDYNEEHLADRIRINPNTRYSFKEIFIDYYNYRESIYQNFREENIKLLESKEPLIKSIYEELGERRVRELNYKRREIEKEARKECSISKKDTILKIMGLKTGDIITVKERKDLFEKVKKKLSLKKTRDISSLYLFTKTSKYVSTSKTPQTCYKVKNIL